MGRFYFNNIFKLVLEMAAFSSENFSQALLLKKMRGTPSGSCYFFFKNTGTQTLTYLKIVVFSAPEMFRI